VNTVGARSKALVVAKDAAKKALLPFARELYQTVQGAVNVSDADKVLLGVNVRAVPTPRPVPAGSPAADVMSVSGRSVTYRLHDAENAGRRGKPFGVAGAMVFTYVGEVAPTDPAAFKFEGNLTRTVFTLTFPETVAPGAKVWFTASWFNERGEAGPGCTPVSATIQYGIGSMAA
jgi:hypothetical protein